MDTQISLFAAIAVASGVINVVLLLLLFSVFNTLNQVKQSTLTMVNAMSSVLVRLGEIQLLTNRIGMGLTDMINSVGDLIDTMSAPLGSGKNVKMYKTSEGDISAGSVDELMKKIGESKKLNEYFNDNELTDLKKMFEVNDDEDDDDEETDGKFGFNLDNTK